MTVQREVLCHLAVRNFLVLDHGVFGTVNDAGLQAGIDIAIRHCGRNCAQRLDHADHQARLLHANVHALHICRGVDLVLGVVEIAGAAIVPGQTVKTGFLHLIAAQDVHAQRLSDLPEMLVVLVDVRHAQRIQIIHELAHGADVDARKLQTAILALLDGRLLIAQNGIVINVDLDAPIGALQNQIGPIP